MWYIAAVLIGLAAGIAAWWWWPAPVGTVTAALAAILASVAVCFARAAVRCRRLTGELTALEQVVAGRAVLPDGLLPPGARETLEKVCRQAGMMLALARDYQVTAGQVTAAVEQMSLAGRNAQEAVATFVKLQEAALAISGLGRTLNHEAEENRRSVEECQEVLQGVLGAINRIRADSSLVAGEIGALSQAVNRVDEIVAGIGQISRHTRLLSLNAAIEAARAGEHGRGFTIVAGEVKNLSDRTQQAVEETEAILEGIKEKVARVVTQIKAGDEGIAAGMEETGHIKESIASIDRGITAMSGRVGEAYQEIEGYLQQVGAAVEVLEGSFNSIQKVGEMMTEVARLVEKNAASGEVAGAGDEHTPVEEAHVEPVMAALRKLAARREIRQLDPVIHASLLQEWLNQVPGVEAVYSNRSDGTFVFSQPPAALANARIRPWWQRAMAGEEYISPVYISAITRQPCRTLSLAIRDEAGQITGVLAADIILNNQ